MTTPQRWAYVWPVGVMHCSIAEFAWNPSANDMPRFLLQQTTWSSLLIHICDGASYELYINVIAVLPYTTLKTAFLLQLPCTSMFRDKPTVLPRALKLVLTSFGFLHRNLTHTEPCFKHVQKQTTKHKQAAHLNKRLESLLADALCRVTSQRKWAGQSLKSEYLLRFSISYATAMSVADPLPV